MTTQNKTMEERMCEVFEIIIQDRNRLKSFIQSEIALAIDNRNREVVEMINVMELSGKTDDYRKAQDDIINLLTSHKRD